MSDVINNVINSGVQFGLVAALEREVSGLVHSWAATHVRIADREQRIYQGQNAALICAGTGMTRAYAAAKLLVEKYSPRVLVSMGFAGACVGELHPSGFGKLGPGAIFVPATVVDFASGKSFPTAFGNGQLVTLGSVAGKGMKQCSAARFGAQAVDMEAAGVAAVAAEHGLEFVAIKAISDGVDEDLEFLSEFVKPDGFQTARFIAHIALRPGLWPRVATLQRNSDLARKSLETAVQACMSDWTRFSSRHSKAAAEV
jgi:adenosylhomocysteine nucleosidase